MLGFSLKFGAQFGILSSDSDWAGIEVTLAHHDAPESDQRRGGESVFFCAE